MWFISIKLSVDIRWFLGLPRSYALTTIITDKLNVQHHITIVGTNGRTIMIYKITVTLVYLEKHPHSYFNLQHTLLTSINLNSYLKSVHHHNKGEIMVWHCWHHLFIKIKLIVLNVSVWKLGHDRMEISPISCTSLLTYKCFYLRFYLICISTIWNVGLCVCEIVWCIS